MTEQQPLGQRFSHVNLQRGAPQQDSSRIRERIFAYFGKAYGNNHAVCGQLASVIHAELGVEVQNRYGGGYNSYDFGTFFRECELRDLLDSITYVWRYLASSLRNEKLAKDWLTFVGRVFREENVAYCLDEHGGVRYFIDEEFERNRIATLSALGAPKYRAVLDAFEAAHRYLDSDPPDTKASVRSAFEAMEILAKLMSSGRIVRLGRTEVEQVLKPFARAAYGSDAVASEAANQLLNGLSDWINAAQPYRHGQAVQEPAAPPVALAVSMLSMGATYLRWLVELSQGSGADR